MKALPQPTLQRVTLADIKASQRLRPVSDAGVEAILASVAGIGRIKDPIHLRRKRDGLTLLAGGHRLAVYHRLETLEADCWVWTDITDDHAKLIEIDDNLAGAEMCALDTAIFLAQRKQVYERLHPETKRGVAGALVRHSASDSVSVASFVASTAEKFGLSPRHVYRMVSAGENLGVDSARLRNIPRQVTLKDLIEISKIDGPAERYAVVDALREGKVRSAGEARRMWAAKENGTSEATEKDPVEDGFNALVKAWGRAPLAAKKRFLLERASEVWEAQNKGASLANWKDAIE